MQKKIKLKIKSYFISKRKFDKKTVCMKIIRIEKKKSGKEKFLDFCTGKFTYDIHTRGKWCWLVFKYLKKKSTKNKSGNS